jgi:PPM family protein phosphatase
VGVHAGRTAAVVCDGVSTSGRSERAARAAAEAGVSALLAGLAGGASAHEATLSGGKEAARAAASAGEPDEVNPPACTYVSAVVSAESVVVGWVGDSPAWWVPAEGEPERLVVDDTGAGRLLAAGVPRDDPRFSLPHAYALERWLGADAGSVPPQIVTIEPSGPGVVLVCSDGLTVPPRDLRAIALGVPPARAAAALVAAALEAGSSDNITVAVLPYPPEVGE